MMKHFQPPYHLLSFPSSPLNTHTNLPFFSLLPSTVIMFPGLMHQKLSPILAKPLQHNALNTIFCQALAVSFASHESIRKHSSRRVRISMNEGFILQKAIFSCKFSIFIIYACAKCAPLIQYRQIILTGFQKSLLGYDWDLGGK